MGGLPAVSAASSSVGARPPMPPRIVVLPNSERSVVVYEPVDPNVEFPKLEEDVLAWWNEAAIPARALAHREGSEEFVFYEGPPTANNIPGVHHVLARAFKDIYPRYHSMKGRHVPRKAGWDCHGLPVEIEIEKR